MGSWFTALWPARPLLLRVRLDGQGVPRLDLVAGPLGHCSVGITVVPTGAGTLVTVDCRVLAAQAALTPLLRRRVLAAAQLLLTTAALAAQEQVVVVAGAIIENGMLLAARRAGPPELAGKWELPGGKVEPGETDRDALARELAEELGIVVTVAEQVGAEVDLGGKIVLRCYRADLSAGRPVPSVHDQLRWVDADGLDGLEWLEADRSLLAELRRTVVARRPDRPGDP